MRHSPNEFENMYSSIGEAYEMDNGEDMEMDTVDVTQVEANHASPLSSKSNENIKYSGVWE